MRVTSYAPLALAVLALGAGTVKAANLKNDPQLVTAAAKGDIAAISHLLATGSNPDSVDAKGHTALDMAAFTLRLDVVKALLAHHAKLASRNPDRVTPLMFAAGSGASAGLLGTLINAGAEVDARDLSGTTALGMAAINHGRAETADFLISKGADVEAENRNFDRPLSLAAESGNTGVMGSLLKAGANQGFALVWETYHKKPGAIQTLLEAGVDVNARYPKARFGSSEGTTALIEAANENDLETASLLIDHGANTNAVAPGTSNMPTALTWAAYHCNADMIRLLLDHGADRTFRNASGKSAADFARTGWTNDMQPCSDEVQRLLQ